ncbi:hypothetical protein, partial [Leifsonia sp. SIMBA_070]|uniref:hypothetical protein n=1 Tax=Leifsonia sp. SIMBA_070 TaxID=3085810 RepID=UPI003978A949
MDKNEFREKLHFLNDKNSRKHEILIDFLRNSGNREEICQKFDIADGTFRKHLSDIYKTFEIEGRKGKQERLFELFRTHAPELVQP